MDALMEPHTIALGSGCVAVVYAAVLAAARFFTFEEPSVVKSLGYVAPYLLLPASTMVAAQHSDILGANYKVHESCATILLV